MIAARISSSSWASQFAGIALIALGIAGLSVPAPTAALQRLECQAVQRIKPVIGRSELGRQILAVYAASEVECHRSL